MKRIYALSVVMALAVAITLSCRKQEFAFQPTYAFPLVDAELSVADIVGARESEVELVYVTSSGGDSLFSYQLIYYDTLEPITPDRLGGTGNTVPNTGGNFISLDSQRVFLRLTGKTETGRFQFDDPTVIFNIENDLEAPFTLRLENMYTENQKTGEIVPFIIDENPGEYPVDITASAGGSTTPGVGTLLINDDNTDDGFDTVFTPSPKYLYYTPALSTTGGTYEDGDELRVTSQVILPLKGTATATYRDTVAYNFSVDDVAEVVDYAFLRMHFENGIPLEARVTGRIVDTSDNYRTVGTLPLWDPETDQNKTNSDNLVVPGGTNIDGATKAPTSSPSELTTDIRIYTENPITGENDVLVFAEGNAIILDIDFGTTEASAGRVVTIYSDQRMKTRMGIKTRLGIEGEADWRDIRDTINSFQE